MVVTLSLSFILYFVSFRKEYIMIYDIENIPNKSSSEESYIVPKIIHFVWTGKPIEEKYIKRRMPNRKTITKRTLSIPLIPEVTKQRRNGRIYLLIE